LRSGDAGWLFLPSGEAVYCYFTELALSQSSQKGAISYSAVFTEADTKRQEKKHFSFTYATEGENAFDIAYREGISVSELMRLNDFKTPFDIKSGDRVVLE
jgi:hypothetical protein